MPPISLLIKPASASCNMKCAYCFYADVSKNRETQNYGIMSQDTLEEIVKKVFIYATDYASFGFQGGEPTLAGLDFYYNLIELQEKYNTKKIKVHNALQTNGYNITKEWAKFFNENDFLIGVSLDGTEKIHNKYRIDNKDEGTFNKVLETTKLFDEYDVQYNILSTVNVDVAKNIDKIYHFFKKQGYKYLQFIPCLDDLEDVNKKEFSLTSHDYGKFLVNLFKLWKNDLFTQNPVSIRYFDNLVSMYAGYPPESCGMSGRCTCYFLIEADASVYPCDFYVLDRWKMGNLLENDFSELLKTKQAKEFVQISEQVHNDCKVCNCYNICRGGCRRNREKIDIDVNGKNKLCSAYKMFFNETQKEFIEITKKLLNKN